MSTDGGLLPNAYLCLFFAALCWLLSVLTGNCSQVDKLWSITPPIYVLVSATLAPCPRTLTAACLSTLWGARLTYNFARKGGYTWPPWQGEEDYRWPVLRQHPLLSSPIAWQVFNISFISLYQHFLLLLITAPAITSAALHAQSLARPFGWLDVATAIVFLLLLLLETVADQQQWEYQSEKYRLRKAGAKLPPQYARGFCVTGVFAWSRHPNFFAEQGMWVVFTGFSLAAGAPLLHWSHMGAGLLVALFQGSTAFTESITAGKYPDYRRYQRMVSRLIPIPPDLQKQSWE